MKSQKKEITWNIVNSLLAGALVFLGTILDGNVNFEGLCVAGVTSLIVAINQFKDYWATEEKEYRSAKLFNFIK